MHVLIIGQVLNGNKRDWLAGGIQTSERDYIQMLLNAGCEVTLFCPQDSERLFEVQGYTQYFCTAPSDDLPWDGPRGKTRRVEAEQAIEGMNPDLIINHSFSSGHVNVTTRAAQVRPVINVIHNPPAAASDISLLAKLEAYKQMTALGGAVVCVSKYQRDLWKIYLKRRITSGKSKSLNFLNESDVDKIFNKVCHPAYARDGGDAQPADFGKHFTLITRPDHHKRVGPFLEIWEKAEKIKLNKLHLFLSHPDSLDSCEYYVKKMKGPIERLKNQNRIIVEHNAPRIQVLDSLALAAGSLIPRPDETFGITFIEAGIAGVPSIVWTKVIDGKVNHATDELMIGEPRARYIDIDLEDDHQVNTLEHHVQELTVRKDSLREETREMFLNLHGEPARRRQLITLIDEVVRDHAKSKNLLLGF